MLISGRYVKKLQSSNRNSIFHKDMYLRRSIVQYNRTMVESEIVGSPDWHNFPHSFPTYQPKLRQQYFDDILMKITGLLGEISSTPGFQSRLLSITVLEGCLLAVFVFFSFFFFVNATTINTVNFDEWFESLTNHYNSY